MMPSEPAVIDTFEKSRIIDRNVVYHQTVRVIFVQHCEPWIESEIVKSNISQINGFVIGVQCV